jgi:superfamily II DNA or RNA helicase/HKD family nuclease
MNSAEPLPPGLYETLVTAAVERAITELGDLAIVAPLVDAETPIRLADHVRRIAERALAGQGYAGNPPAQVRLVNRLLQIANNTSRLAGNEVVEPPRLLEAVLNIGPTGLGAKAAAPQRPSIPLSHDSLLVNALAEPKLATELRHEMKSADRIDLLCAFVVWTGVRVVLEELREARSRGVPIRVITSTYTGITDARALDELTAMGAEVRVSYEVGATRLHAKAWLFERNTGFSTAYIGSSNLTHTALHDGIEWNVRLTQHHSGSLLDRFRAAFETYWADAQFEPYNREKFVAAVAAIRTTASLPIAMLEVRPLDFQARMLEQLRIERDRFDRHRNLIVAATGTGKTVMAALDYARLAESWKRATLLFVAHRQEILAQSLATFRAVLRDGNFGELMVGGARPSDGSYVFASIQSLAHVDLEEVVPRDRYDMVIIDEFHHAAAPTYRRLLEHVRPRELLGLTATPERGDLQDVTAWFGNRVAAELRLWEAIDYGYLCPFQYFGISDGSSLEAIEFKRGRYNVEELERIYTGNDARVSMILEAIRRLIDDPGSMRAFGFCVSVSHAEFMAKRFTEAGIRSAAVTGSTPDQTRRAVLRDLRERKLNCVFSVEVFNEGVDVPAIDTVLFLRPTESATVFLQQLGRGLRRAPGKAGLTVLDFIGHQNRAFRFAPRFQVLTGRPAALVERDVESDFPYLPAGCHIHLDRVSRDIVLENVRQSIRSRRADLAAELRELGDLSLTRYLTETGRSLDEIYRGTPMGWMALRRLARLPVPPSGANEETLVKAINRLRHIDDPERVGLYVSWLRSPVPVDDASLDLRQQRLLQMLLSGLWGDKARISTRSAVERLWQHPAVREELAEVLEHSAAGAESIPNDARLGWEVPLLVHERYTRDEALIGLGDASFERPPTLREGVKSIKDLRADCFFVTLDKSGSSFSPTTRYRDYPISRTEFHWESQSMTRLGSPAGQRYLGHRDAGWRFLLFVRESPQVPGGRTATFLFLGRVQYVRHQGETPIQVTWRLEQPMPAGFFESARAAV